MIDDLTQVGQATLRAEPMPGVPGRGRGAWSTKKRDAAPRGVFRHPSGVWAIRFTCGAGHIHKERVGPIKSDAHRTYHERRARTHAEPGWCPGVERERERGRAQAEHERAARRVTFSAYAKDYLAWAKLHHRGWDTERSRVNATLPALGEKRLDSITTADVERFLDGLLPSRAPATRNRYRTTLHAMFNRAIRHGLVAVNPVHGVAKRKLSS